MFFEGEIYNKSELGRFSIDQDVVRSVYRQSGLAGISKIRGSFVAGIKDGEKTILIRDQFGAIPLYYSILSEEGGSVVCGTSLRKLLDSCSSRKLSYGGLFSYLSYGCLYAPYTLIEGIRIVPPGCAVIIEKGEFTCERYWKPIFDIGNFNLAQAQNLINENLARAVEEQTFDAPAAFLSGGIDSSAIVALWRKQYDGEIRTYCVTHEDARTDERKWARLVAERNHTKHTELMLEDRLIRKWFDEAVSSYDQPSLDGLNFWFATKLLKEQTDEKVMLSGEGGDELFGGYGQFAKHRLAYKYALIMKHMPRFVGALIDAYAPKEKFRKLAMLAGFKGEPYYVPRRILSDWQISKVLRPELLPNCARLDGLNLTTYSDLPGDLFNRISWLEMQTVVANMWMRDGYQTSHHNGISVRTPLCDARLAELLYTIPGAMKCDAVISKPILVHAAGDGIPHECVVRPKLGFSLPFDRYFSGELKDRIDEFLSGNNTRLFKPAVIREMGRLYRSGKLYWSRIWELFMVENWCRENKVEIA